MAEEALLATLSLCYNKKLNKEGLGRLVYQDLQHEFKFSTKKIFLVMLPTKSLPTLIQILNKQGEYPITVKWANSTTLSCSPHQQHEG